MKTKKMRFKSIRNRIRAILVLMFISAVLAVFLILNNVMMDKIDILENRYATENMERVQNIVDHETQRLAATAVDWAVWDDTYEYIHDKSEKYVKANFVGSAFSNLGINTMVFIDEHGEIVFDGELDPEKKELGPVSRDFIDYIKKSPVASNTDPDYRLHGIIMLPDRAMMVAACPILLSDGNGPVRGHLVMGIDFDDEKIAFLAQQLDMNLKIADLQSLDAGQAAGLAPVTDQNPISVQKLNADKIASYSVLPDIYGQPALGAVIEMDRDVHAIGISGIMATLMLLIAVFLIFTMVTFMVIDESILFRLQELSKEIRRIGEEKKFFNRLQPQDIQDELTAVSDEINVMLNELEKAQLQVSDSERALKQAVQKLEMEVAERKKAQERVKYMAYHDKLTGLPNRWLLIDLMNHSIDVTGRTKKILAVMFLDIDGFKKINDMLGHDAGDQLLQEVAVRLVQTLRKADVVARLGGDEFIVLVEHLEDMANIGLIADKIIHCFDEPFIFNSQAYFITTSIGVATYPDSGQTPNVLIKNADTAMYEAKSRGKNQWVLRSWVDEDMVEEADEAYGNL